MSTERNFSVTGPPARLSEKPTAAEQRIIKPFLAKRDELTARLDQVNNQAARRKRHKLVDGFNLDPSQPNYEALKAGLITSQREEERGNREVRSTLKHAQKQLNREASKAFAPVVDRILPKVIAAYDQREAEERAFAESVGVEFRPSFSLLAIGSRIAQLQQLADVLARGEGSVNSLDGIVSI